jgi:hypothetical protein
VRPQRCFREALLPRPSVAIRICSRSRLNGGALRVVLVIRNKQSRCFAYWQRGASYAVEGGG